MNPRRLLLGTGLALGLAACGMPQQGPQMMPGSDCMSCHSSGGAAIASHAWTLAGTVFADPKSPTAAPVQAAEVLVTDAAGKTLTIRTNGSGNFYSAEPLTFPVHVEVQDGSQRMAMVASPPVGSCNACHAGQGLNGAPGKLFVPVSAK